MFKLVIQDDEGKTTVVPLIRDEITVGRKEGNTIRLTERNVSRKHARILRHNGSIAIEDLNSYNGVRVNGSRIQGRCDLSVSDRVQIGDYLIEIKAENALPTEQMGNQKTAPIERVDAQSLIAQGIPVPQSAAEDAQTTKINANVMAAAAAATKPPGVASGSSPNITVPPNVSMPPTSTIPPIAAAASTIPPQPAVTVPPSQPQAQAQGHARLVVLSTNFAGREFVLDKPAMVIGRTDENDIVINHRSISRNHAKIVRENNRYAIVDLQSSNGVRVNGEEYGKVELRRADVVDLGHVRMRFVEAGEDFLFGRDAQAVDITPRGGKGLIYALIGVAVIAVIAIVLMSRGGDPEPSGGVVDQGDPKDPKDVVAPPKAAVADAGTQQMVAPENTELLKALDAARAAIKDEEWDDVQKHVDKALAIDGENAAAKQLSQQARDEAENKKHYDELVKASKQKKYASYGVVVSEFDQVKHDSAYRERAREAHDKVKADYQRTTTTQANKLARAKQCDELRQLAVDAGKLWEDVGASIEAIAERCKPRVAVVNPKPDPPKPKPDPPKPKPDPPKRNYDELVSEIRDASKNGQYGRALRRCGDAIKQKRESSTILMCGNAACNLKNEGLARRYMGMLGQEREKLFIRKSCLRAGLTID